MVPARHTWGQTLETVQDAPLSSAHRRFKRGGFRPLVRRIENYSHKLAPGDVECRAKRTGSGSASAGVLFGISAEISFGFTPESRLPCRRFRTVRSFVALRAMASGMSRW